MLIPLIDILDRHSIDTRSILTRRPSTPQVTLNQHSIDILVDSSLGVNQFLIDAYEVVDTQPNINWQFVQCQLSID